MLSDDEKQKILLDLLNKVDPPRIIGQEADDYRALLEKDIEDAKENGAEIIDIIDTEF